MLFGSRIINCSQEEAFGNLLSRLAGRRSQVLRESGWSCDFFFFLLCDQASLSNKTLSRSGLISTFIHLSSLKLLHLQQANDDLNRQLEETRCSVPHAHLPFHGKCMRNTRLHYLLITSSDQNTCIHLLLLADECILTGIY